MKRVLIFFLILAIIISTSSCQKKYENKIFVYNWGEYIADGVIEEFEKETGITVEYEEFDSNEAMYATVKNREGEYDLLFPSEYMIERMINENMLEKINLENIPNFKNIDEKFKNLDADPKNEYLASYMWGTLGILYNKKMVDEKVDSWEILWNEKYSKKVFMYSSVRDSFAVALKLLGHSLNSTNIDEIKEAEELLVKQKHIIKTYLGDNIKHSMINEEGALAVVYSGDAMFCQDLNEDLDYAIPKEGSNLFYDAMVIPKGAKNKEGAETFINFLLRADISARNSEYIGYSTTNIKALEYMDKEIVENPIYWIKDEDFTKLEIFRDLGDFKKEYDNAWINLSIRLNN